MGLGCLFGLHRVVDPDVLLQVVVGRAILQDPNSVGLSTFIEAYPRFPYLEDKWLASVFVAVADALGGEDGLMVYQIALCAAVAAAWFWMQRAWRASPAVAVVGVALALLACSFRLEPRPDTMSHALLACVIGLSIAGVPFRTLASLVVAMMLLWVNIHGYFLNGIIVLSVAAACTIAGDRTRSTLRPGAGELSAPQRFILVGLALVVCLIHPQGWRALAYPIQQLVALYRTPTFKSSIEEFTSSVTLLSNMGTIRVGLLVLTAGSIAGLEVSGRSRSPLARQLAALAATLPWLVAPPPGLVALPYRVTFALLIVAAFEIPARLRQRSFIGPALLIGFTILALPLIRNVALIPPAALILIAPAWTRAVEEWHAAPRFRLPRYVYVAVPLLACVLVGWIRLSDRLSTEVAAPPRTGWGIDNDRFPAAAIRFLDVNRLPDPLFNNFDIGGYLLYRLYPRRHAFIAGHTSMYPMSFYEYYQSIVRSGSLSDLYAKYRTETVIFDLASPGMRRLTAALAGSSDWALVFLDRTAAVFLHVTPRSREFCDRHRVDIEARVRELMLDDHAAPALPEWLGGKALAVPRFNLGMFLFWYGRPDLALQEARRLWSRPPSEDLAVIEGEAARRSQQLVEELPRLENALAVYPESTDLKTYMTLGLALRADERMRRGAADEAERDLRRMLALAPTACGPYAGLAKLAAMKGDLGQAREYLNEALRRDVDRSCRRGIELDPELAGLL